MSLFAKILFGRHAAFLILLTTFCCVGCKHSGTDDNSVAPDRTDFSPTEAEKTLSAAPGFGNSTAEPTGQVWTLPTDLLIDGPIRPTYGSPPDSARLIGGNDLQYVTLLFDLSNTTRKAIQVILPRGLVFISSDNDRQNGLLVQSDTLLLNPGKTTVEAGLYCLNDNRLAAGGSETYRIGPVTQLPAMVELLGLLSTKSVAQLSVSEIADYSFLVQNAVWQVAHTGKVPAGLQRQLQQLP